MQSTKVYKYVENSIRKVFYGWYGISTLILFLVLIKNNVQVSDLAKTLTIEENTVVFEEIFKVYWPKLYVYSFKIMRNQEICEDLLQEIFSSFWLQRNEVKIRNLSAYLFQAVRFQIYKYYRDTRYELLDIDKFEHIMHLNATDDLLNLKETKELIVQYIDELLLRCREIFYLSRFQGLSHKEISDKLNISNQTVKNQITIALKYLKTHYKEIVCILLLNIK